MGRQDQRSSPTPLPTFANTDVGVLLRSTASAVPSLKQFVREVTHEVPSPQGGTVYDQWLRNQEEGPATGVAARRRTPRPNAEVTIGTLGSGSDYTPFLQHLGIPSTDITSDGPYGVYHSVFDNYNWFTKFADPTFAYLQQQARVFGLEVLHMADADVLPYDYRLYLVKEVVNGCRRPPASMPPPPACTLDFTAATAAAARFKRRRQTPSAPASSLPSAIPPPSTPPSAPPNRPCSTPPVFPAAPGTSTPSSPPAGFRSFAAVVIPGVNEAIDARRERCHQRRVNALAQTQLGLLAAALNRSAAILEIRQIASGNPPDSIWHQRSHSAFPLYWIPAPPIAADDRSSSSPDWKEYPVLYDMILAFGFLAMVLAPAIIAMRTNIEEENLNTKKEDAGLSSHWSPPASTATHTQMPTPQ